MPTTRKFINQATTAITNDFINDLCSDANFLCSHRDDCSVNSSHYGTLENINDICNKIVQSGKCENEIDKCVVSAETFITSTRSTVNTSFVDIIVPIPNAVDDYGNSKFLRLPPLSGSRIPGSKDICNACACFERFAKSPGDRDTDYTSPGQNECIFSNTFEYLYYPLEIENINNKIGKDLVINKYNIVNKNIIYANSSEDLLVENLYDILIRNGISKNTAFNFLINILYSNDRSVELKLKSHLDKNLLSNLKEKEEKRYSNNIISIYIIFITFVILILFNI